MIKEPRIHNGERTVFSINGFGKTEQPQEKNETGLLSYAIQKYYLNMY